jgi:chromosome segregation ATPase
MINKLYKLKQQQINQQVQLKQQVLSKIDEIDMELHNTNNALHTATVDIMGAISDFRVLQIHKETMKDHMVKLAQKKELLQKQVENYNNIIVSLNKESEQFNYMIQEEKKKKLKEVLKQEETVASEYVQAKYIQNKKVADVY